MNESTQTAGPVSVNTGERDVASYGKMHQVGRTQGSSALQETGTQGAQPTTDLPDPVLELPSRVRLRLWMSAARSFERVSVRPFEMSGQPTVGDACVPVYMILAHIARGLTPSQIVEEFDGEIEEADIEEALQFTAALVR